MLYQSAFLMLKWTLKCELLSFPVHSAVNNYIRTTTVLARQIMYVCVCVCVCVSVCVHACVHVSPLWDD